MTFDNRKYVIIPTQQVHLVDFTQVMETSAETCRYSVDGSQTFVKYLGDMPPSVAQIQTKSEEYTHEQILDIMNSSDWQDPQPPIV